MEFSTEKQNGQTCPKAIEASRISEASSSDSEPPPYEYVVGKPYEPYDHRNVKNPTTYFETLVHLLKASLGTGILAMPDAFHNSGYALGVVATCLIGILCAYCINTLIRTEYELCKRKRVPSMTYPEIAKAAVEEGPLCITKFAPAMKVICNLFLLLYQIGSCCIYVVFIATNVKDVVDHILQYPESYINIRWFILMTLLPLIIINWIRNWKYLAPLSTLANAVTLVSFIIIFYYIFESIPSIDQRNPVAPMNRVPLFFGTVLFAMEAIGVIIPLENEMKDPKRFVGLTGVLNCALIPIILVYTSIGFFGYLKYGEGVRGSITLSLPLDSKYAQASRLMLAFAIYITHALNCFVAFEILWGQFVGPRVRHRKLLVEYILRTALVILTVLLAAVVPDLELFISFIGTICLSTTGLAFPALFQLSTFWNDYTGNYFLLFLTKNLLITVIALIGFVIGSTTSLNNIIEKFF